MKTHAQLRSERFLQLKESQPDTNWAQLMDESDALADQDKNTLWLELVQEEIFKNPEVTRKSVHQALWRIREQLKP